MDKEFLQQFSDLVGTVIDSELGPWQMEEPIPGVFSWTLKEDNVYKNRFYDNGDPGIQIITKLTTPDNSGDPDKFFMDYNLFVKGTSRSFSRMQIQFGDSLPKEKYIEYINAFIHDGAVETLKQWGNYWIYGKHQPVTDKEEYETPIPDAYNHTDLDIPDDNSEKGTKQESLNDVLVSNNEDSIIKFAKSKKLSSDEALDIYNKAKELKSNKLMNFAKSLLKLESFSFKDFYLITEGTTSYGCLMAYIPKDECKQFVMFAKEKIDKGNLAEDAIEDEPHTTILYGFHGDLSDEIKDLLHNWGELECELGKISRFEQKKKGYDVIKVEVKSLGIKKLHDFLLRHYEDKITTDFPEWKGHLTLAYVKPGTHKELNGDNTFAGIKFKFDKLIYSPPKMKNKTKFSIVK